MTKTTKKKSNRRINSWEPGIYYDRLMLAYGMASYGANSKVLIDFFVVDKRLELAINKDLSKFRKGSGWMMTHVIHRTHANIVYKMYCNSQPSNVDFHRPVTPEELLAISKMYLITNGNEYLDINRIYYIFKYLRDGTFGRKICNKCGIDYIFHAKRTYNHCPFCEKYSTLFKSKYKNPF